jgi:predicted acetyltransferase
MARRTVSGAALERLSGIQGPQDRQQVIETFGRAFAGPNWMEDYMRDGLFRGPIFDPEHTRVAVADGRVVAGVTMAPRAIRFGSVTVPAMTVGPVGTHDHYRKRGYGAAAMHDASRYMKENGILVAYLSGIPNFYYRFGYYPYMAAGRFSFRREDARKEAATGRLRRMRRRDLPVVRRIYDAATGNRTCAAARDDVVWDWLMGAGGRTRLFHRPSLILDGKGRPCGYLTTGRQPHQPDLSELILRNDEAACRAALGAVVRYAKRAEMQQIELRLPWDDPFAVFIRQYVPAEWKTSSNPTGGPLLKVVDFPALMKRLEPVFTERWRNAHSALPRVRFTLAGEIGKVGVVVSKRRVDIAEPAGRRVVRVPQRWLSGLLTGYHTVGEVMKRRGARVPTALMPYLRILFPTGWPFVYQADNY